MINGLKVEKLFLRPSAARSLLRKVEGSDQTAQADHGLCWVAKSKLFLQTEREGFEHNGKETKLPYSLHA